MQQNAQNMALNVLEVVRKDNVVPFKRKRRKHTGGATKGGASALRNKEDVLNIMRYFLNHSTDKFHKSFGIRNYALVCFGFNTALRAGDLLSLKLSDVINPETKEIVDEFVMEESKPKKTRVVFINNAMKSALKLYLEKERTGYQDKLDEPLFLSRQKNSETGELKPITKERYGQLMKEVQRQFGLSGKISTHTCRKTWARMMYDNAPDGERQHILVLISAMLNHSNIETTMIYLDIQKDELRNLSKSQQLGLLEAEYV